ncbi:MAG: O-antigen ligase family protein [Balneolaceae bacterium]
MIKAESSYNGVLLIAPIVVGAFLSGIVYLAEGAAIPLTIFQLALIAGFLLFFVKKLSLKEIDIEVYGLEIFYLLFLAIILFSLIYSPERAQGLFSVIRFSISLGLTYLIYNAINSEKELKIICAVIIGVALVVAVQNLMQTYLNPEIAAFNYLNQGEKLLRAKGTENDPNIFASNFIMPVMLLVAFIGSAKTKTVKLVLFGVAAVIISAVLVSYSRSSWVAIFIGVAIILIRQRQFSFILYSLLAFLLAFSMSGTIQNLVFSVFERFLDIFSGVSDDSSKFRILLAQTAFLMAFDTYLLGVGYESFSTVFQKYHPPQETIGIYEPHNEFYAVFAELGLIGLVVFLIIIFKVISAGINTLKKYEARNLDSSIVLALLASFIAYMCFFQFLSGMQHHNLLMINIGLLFCTRKVLFLGTYSSKE